MILISIPDDIKSEFDGYNYFISMFYSLRDLYGEKVVFDFGKVSFFEANLSALFGVCLEFVGAKNEIVFINIQNQVETILRKNGFLTQLGYNQIFDRYDTSLKYKKFSPKDDFGFNNYIQSQLLSKPNFPSISDLLAKEITRNIFEIYENARTHGKCDYIHTCGQFFPKKINKPLHFTIVDKGINIKENVSNFLHRNIDAEEAIDWAMQKGNTTKTGDTSGGLGLAVIFDFIKLNNGKIQIVSANGFYEFNRGDISKQRLDDSFDGTIVNIMFNLNDTKNYRLSSEIADFDNIF